MRKWKTLPGKQPFFVDNVANHLDHFADNLMNSHKTKFIAMAGIGLAYPQRAQADPNLPDLTAVYYLFFGIVGATALSLLIRAFFQEEMLRRFLFALPAKILVLLLTPQLFSWDSSYLVPIVFSLFLSILIIHLYLERFGKKLSLLAGVTLTSAYLLAILLNPAYFRFVKIVPVENDPFNGKGVTVIDVSDYSYIFTDENGQYRVDNTLVLENDMRIPGIFHQSHPGDVVVVKAKTSGDYAYEIYGQETLRYQEITPLIDFPPEPVFERELKLNHLTGAIGWGHDF